MDLSTHTGLPPGAPPPRSDVADAVLWATLCERVARLRQPADGKVKEADRAALLPPALLAAARHGQQSLYPYVRLLVPRDDSKRQKAGLGVATIAELYGKLHSLPEHEVARLKAYENPASHGGGGGGGRGGGGRSGHRWGRRGGGGAGAVGDFIGTLEAFLREREGSAGSGVLSPWSVKDVNAWLDELVLCTSTEQKLALFRRLPRHCTPREQAYLMSALLGDHKMRTSVDTLLKYYHPDAPLVFHATRNLEGIFANPALRDPAHRIAAEIRLGVPFAPMRGARAAFETTVLEAGSGAGAGIAATAAINPLKSWTDFFIERKLDGERAVVHLLRASDGSPDLRIFSRSSRQRTDYEEVLRDDLLAALIYAEEAILDGELIAWSSIDGSLIKFGENRSIAIEMKAAMEAGQPPDVIKARRLCFVAFDILHYKPTPFAAAALAGGKQLAAPVPGGAPLRPFSRPTFAHLESSMQLSERRRLLEAVLVPSRGAVMLVDSTRVSAPSLAERKRVLLEHFDAAIERGDEGLMVKHADSSYELKDSAKNPKWVKVKPEYSLGAFQTMDLVILGGYYPEGFRAGLRGRICRFLLGVAVESKMVIPCPPRPASRPAVHTHGGREEEGGGGAGDAAGAGGGGAGGLEEGAAPAAVEGGHGGAAPATLGLTLPPDALNQATMNAEVLASASAASGAAGGGFRGFGASFAPQSVPVPPVGQPTGVRPLPSLWVPVCKVGSGYTIEDVGVLERLLGPHALTVKKGDPKRGPARVPLPPPAPTGGRGGGVTTGGAPRGGAGGGAGYGNDPTIASLQASLPVEGGNGGANGNGGAISSGGGEVTWNAVPWLPAGMRIPAEDIPDVIYPPWCSVVLELKGSEILHNDKWPLKINLRFPRVEAIREDKPVNDILTDVEILDMKARNGGRLTFRGEQYADAGAARKRRKAGGEGATLGRPALERHGAPGQEWPTPAQLAAVRVENNVLKGRRVVLLPGFYEGLPEGRVSVAYRVKKLGGRPLPCLPAEKKEEGGTGTAARGKKVKGSNSSSGGAGGAGLSTVPDAAADAAAVSALGGMAPEEAAAQHEPPVVISPSRTPLAHSAVRAGHVIYSTALLDDAEAGGKLSLEPDPDVLLLVPEELMPALQRDACRFSSDSHVKPTTEPKLRALLEKMKLTAPLITASGEDAVARQLQRIGDARDVGALLFNAGNTIASDKDDADVAEEVGRVLRAGVFRYGGRLPLPPAAEQESGRGGGSGGPPKRARRGAAPVDLPDANMSDDDEVSAPTVKDSAHAPLLIDPSAREARYRLFPDEEGVWNGFGLQADTAVPAALVGAGAGEAAAAAVSAAASTPVSLGAAGYGSVSSLQDWQHPGVPPPAPALTRIRWDALGTRALLAGVVAFFDSESEGVATLGRVIVSGGQPVPPPPRRKPGTLPPLDVDPRLLVAESSFRAHKGRVVAAHEGRPLPDVIVASKGWGAHRWEALQRGWATVAALSSRNRSGGGAAAGRKRRRSPAPRQRRLGYGSEDEEEEEEEQVEDEEGPVTVLLPPVVDASWVAACVEAGVLVPLDPHLLRQGDTAHAATLVDAVSSGAGTY